MGSGGSKTLGLSSFNPFKWNSDDWLNAAVQTVSVGALGTRDGKLEQGWGQKAGSMVISEATGQAQANRLMERELKNAEARAVEERENMRRLREEEQMMAQRDDIAASSRARSGRRQTRSSDINQGNFLGL